jgi:hypothetical protein
VWAGGDASDAAGEGGNPGESGLARGGEGELIMIAGSPKAGNIGVATIASGEVRVLKAVPCAAESEPVAAPATTE